MSDSEHERRSARSAADLAAWNEAADRYASAVGGPDDRIYASSAPPPWTALSEDLRGLEILDLWCGLGWLSALMADTGTRVRGMDGSDALLAHARRAVPHVEFLRCDLTTESPPIDRRYDRIVAHMVLMDLLNVDRTVAYVRRVLARAGRFIFTMPHPYFFNYKTRPDPDTGELSCGVTNYLALTEWWVDIYGGHARPATMRTSRPTRLNNQIPCIHRKSSVMW